MQWRGGARLGRRRRRPRCCTTNPNEIHRSYIKKHEIHRLLWGLDFGHGLGLSLDQIHLRNKFKIIIALLQDSCKFYEEVHPSKTNISTYDENYYYYSISMLFHKYIDILLYTHGHIL
jgi:hypothetical protein